MLKLCLFVVACIIVGSLAMYPPPVGDYGQRVDSRRWNRGLDPWDRDIRRQGSSWRDRDFWNERERLELQRRRSRIGGRLY